MRFRVIGAFVLASAGLLAIPAYAADTANPFGGTLGDKYASTTIRIAPGDSVTFSGDFTEHPLKSGRNDFAFAKSGGGAGSFTKAYPSAGVFRYYCTIHGSQTADNRVSGMAGQVIVGDPALLPKAVFAVTAKSLTFKGSTAKLKLNSDKRGSVRVVVRKLKNSKPSGANLAKGTAAVANAGSATAKLRLTKSGKGRLAKGSSLKVALTATFTDLDGNVVVKTVKLRVKR
jgi:plastocyanin